MSAVERLDEIQARADKATDGPWEWESTSPSMAGGHWNLRVTGKPGIRLSVTEYQHGPGNAEFIAHARADVPALVAALRAVLDLHQPTEVLGRGSVCPTCDPWRPYPCPTVRAVEAALEVER